MATEPDMSRVSTADFSLRRPAETGLAQLWQCVEADWHDAQVHRTYLANCTSAADLARAAGNYRAYLADPERKAVAESQLKLIAAAAMAQLEVTRAVRQTSLASRPYGKLLLIVLFLVGSAMLFRLL